MFYMKFKTKNDAFRGDSIESEIARILRDTAQRIENGEATGLHQNLRDLNGNVVGTFKLDYTE